MEILQQSVTFVADAITKKVSRFLFCHEKKIYLTHNAFKWANPVLYFFIFVFSKFELTHKYNQTFFW